MKRKKAEYSESNKLGNAKQGRRPFVTVRAIDWK